MKATEESQLQKLRDLLREASPVMVAWSGGVDSSVLLAVAAETPGVRTLGVMADSPSLPRSALARALEEAARRGWPVEVLKTYELADPNYAANPTNRCYFCKAELFARMEQRARELGFRTLAYGEHAGDDSALRPGSVAAEEFRVLAPLKIAGMHKPAIRALARHLGLSAAELPATPCLSSRIAHGVPVTAELLALIERAEEKLFQRGFRIVRVRVLPVAAPGKWPSALVQVAPSQTPALLASAAEVCAELRDLGFCEVQCDPAGYQGASLETAV